MTCLILPENFLFVKSLSPHLTSFDSIVEPALHTRQLFPLGWQENPISNSYLTKFTAIIAEQLSGTAIAKYMRN
jgi:hypothetical protein